MGRAGDRSVNSGVESEIPTGVAGKSGGHISPFERRSDTGAVAALGKESCNQRRDGPFCRAKSPRPGLLAKAKRRPRRGSGLAISGSPRPAEARSRHSRSAAGSTCWWRAARRRLCGPIQLGESAGLGFEKRGHPVLLSTLDQQNLAHLEVEWLDVSRLELLPESSGRGHSGERLRCGAELWRDDCPAIGVPRVRRTHHCLVRCTYSITSIFHRSAYRTIHTPACS